MAGVRSGAGAVSVLRLLWVLLVLLGDGGRVVGAGPDESCGNLANIMSWCQPLIKCSLFWSDLVKSPQSMCPEQTQSGGISWKACCPVVVDAQSQSSHFFLFFFSFFLALEELPLPTSDIEI